MKRLVSALALAAVVAITGGPVHATEVPGTLSFTARLVDDKSDAPVAGAHSVVFALFDAEAAGHSVWNETHSVTIAEDGLVFVELGDTTALDSRVFDGTDRWLEITVDGNVMSPRIVLDSVPYAVRSTAAANADAVGGKTVDQLQPKLTGSCNNGQHIQNIGADGSIQCASDSSATGDITAVVAGTGLAGGAAAGDATVSLMACAANQILKFTGAGWACAADNDSGDITAVTAGSGLIGGGSSGAVTIAMTNTCTAGQLLKWNGTAWTCAADIDTDTNSGGTITGVTAGPGLIGGGTSGTVALSLPNTCASGQVLKWSGATWMCANDLDTDTNSGGTITGVTAGAGLTGGGTTGTATVNVGQGVGIVVQADTVGLDTAFTDTRYLMLTGGTMAGAINMNGFRVTNRGCPVGYVKVGTAFCTESQDTSGLTFTGAASHCAATGAHLCSSAEARAIIALGTTLSDNMLLDWVDDQDADGSALYINNATASEDPDGVRATSTSSYARCCVNLE